jgi:hypothetical protein
LPLRGACCVPVASNVGRQINIVVPKETEMPAPTITELRSSNYMKLLEYAASNIGKPFTAQDAITATAVSRQVFEGYVGSIYSEITANSGRYGITIDTIPKYIEFLEFEEAKASAESAKAEAKSAQKIALFAIGISIIVALTQVGIQVMGTTTLDKKQFLALVQASNSVHETIIKNQTPQLVQLAAKLDKGNDTLQKVEQNQVKQMATLEKVAQNQVKQMELMKSNNQPGNKAAQ